MPVYERLSMMVSLTLISLALYFIIDLPSRIFNIPVFGLTLTITASQRLLMVILLGGLAFTGSGAVIRSHPQQRVRYTVPFWVNATLIVVLATLVLVQASSPTTWVIGLLGTGLLLWFTVLAEYHAIEQNGLRFKAAQLWSQWISYSLLAIYTILLKETQVGPIIQIISVFILSWLLAASIFKLYGKNTRVFGFLIALGIAQVAWVLNYWHLSSTSTGLLTLLIFYALCGIIISHLQQTLSRRVVLEYGMVAVVGIWLVAQFVG